MRRVAALVLLAFVGMELTAGSAQEVAAEFPSASAAKAKARVVVLTDIENEPDDTMSMVRLLTYSNEIDIEGLIATTSMFMTDRVAPESIHNVVAAYGKVRSNLLLHESGFPTEEHLNTVVKHGLPVYGMRVSEKEETPRALIGSSKYWKRRMSGLFGWSFGADQTPWRRRYGQFST